MKLPWNIIAISKIFISIIDYCIAMIICWSNYRFVKNSLSHYCRLSPGSCTCVCTAFYCVAVIFHTWLLWFNLDFAFLWKGIYLITALLTKIIKCLKHIQLFIMMMNKGFWVWHIIFNYLSELISMFIYLSFSPF